MLTMEQKQFVGPQQVMEKLQSLGDGIRHSVECVDCQPTARGGVLVVVTGKIMLGSDAAPMNFNQTFQLFPINTSYFVLNDIFRLNIG